MFWNNLEKNRCPSCSKLLKFDSHAAFCADNRCRFRIGLKRMSEIIQNKASPQSGGVSENSDNDDIF
jgi:hypothetical protein